MPSWKILKLNGGLIRWENHRSLNGLMTPEVLNLMNIHQLHPLFWWVLSCLIHQHHNIPRFGVLNPTYEFFWINDDKYLIFIKDRSIDLPGSNSIHFHLCWSFFSNVFHLPEMGKHKVSHWWQCLMDKIAQWTWEQTWLPHITVAIIWLHVASGHCRIVNCFTPKKARLCWVHNVLFFVTRHDPLPSYRYVCVYIYIISI